MTQIPVMPFYPDSYIADTRMLTLEEKGAYTDLLFHLWLQGGKLPHDDQRIARLLGVSSTAWRRLKDNLQNFFQYSEGFFTQKRLCRELENVRARREKNTRSGQKGGQAKAEKASKNKESEVANATDSLAFNPGDKLSKTPGDVASESRTSRARVNLNPSVVSRAKLYRD